MEKISYLIILEILKKDIEKKSRFLEYEYDHMASIIEFFTLERIDNNTFLQNIKKDNTYISTAFRHLIPISRFLKEEIEHIKNLYNELENIDLEKQDYSSNIHLSHFFDIYTKLLYEINRTIENFNFLQRKIINIINSYPFYYPSPKVSSYKEASKIHFFLEWVSNDFLGLLKKNIYRESGENVSFNTSFYWSFSTDIKFIPDFTVTYEGDNNIEKKIANLVISSDFSLPYRRSHYVLVLHECLHFFFKFLDQEYKSYSFKTKNSDKKDIDESFPREFVDLRNYIAGTISITNKINNFMDFDLILDIFIDSILTHILGKLYYIPLFSHIFLYDEEFFVRPELRRNWYIRSYVPLYFLNDNDDSNDKVKDKDIKDSVKTLLDYYKELQINTTSMTKHLYNQDDSAIEVLRNYIEKYIDKYIKDVPKKFNDHSNLFLKLKQFFNKPENSWLHVLLDYQREYINNILERYSQKDRKEHYKGKTSNPKEDANTQQKDKKEYYEGRTLAVKIHNKLLNYNREYELVNIPQKDLQIFSFKYHKLRLSESMFGINLPINYGSYTFLEIQKKPASDTTNSEKSTESNDNVLKNQFYFTNSYELTLYEGNATDLEKHINNINKKIIVNIKLLFQREENSFSFKKAKENIEKSIEEVKSHTKYVKNIQPFYFISFDWFDIFLSLFIDIEDNKCLNFLNLLNNIKKHILIDVSYIHRSETEIFIGSEIKKLIIIQNPVIQLRINGRNSNTLDSIREVISKDKDIHFIYGIKDLEIRFNSRTNFSNLLEITKELVKRREDNLDISDIQFVPYAIL